MKHIKHLAATVAMLLCCINASAYDFQVDGIYYNIINNSTHTVEVTYATTSYNSYTGTVVIPEIVTYAEVDYEVQGIGYEAFRACSGVTSIIIPESVSQLDSYAFYGCTSLVTIDIPIGVTTIRYNTFYNCSSLTSVTLPNGLTSIGNNAFYGCSSLSSITIPDGVVDLGFSAFRGCINLISINIPKSIKSIGENAFLSCNSLNDIYISCIDAWCDIYFSNNASNPFVCAKNLYVNGVLTTELVIANTMKSIKDYVFYGCENITSIAIPETVTSVGNGAFEDCSSLTSINLPENVTSIGSSAFERCSSLASITVPKNVASIGKNAFRDCSSLTSIALPEGVTSIYDYDFSGCSSLAFITLPDGLTSIGFRAFYNCTSLTSISIPESVTSIGSSAFYNCSNLISISIPGSVTSIGDNAFNYCTSLRELRFEDGNEFLSIGGASLSGSAKGLFKTSPLENLYLGRDLKVSTYSPFYENETLSSVTISENVTSICYLGFNGCSNLSTLIIPQNVTSIGSKAFEESAKEIIIQSTVPPTLKTSADLMSEYTVVIVPTESYNDYSTDIYWKNWLPNITIDDSAVHVKKLTLEAGDNKSALHAAIGDDDLKFVTDLTISGTINSYDFMILRNKMPLLRHLNLKNASIVYNAYEHYTGYCTYDNKLPDYGLYNCNLFTLVLPKTITNIGKYAIGSNSYLSEVTLFEGVTSIENFAFSNCNSLFTITIPDGATSIGYGAFQDCKNLASITLPNGVSIIDDSSFKNCYNLNSIILPPTMEKIGESAFWGCSKLSEIRIPSSVRTVGDNAFRYCSSLNDVYVYTVEPISIGQETFTKDGNNFVGTLHAPKVSYWDYYYDTQWSQFASFAEFDEPYENFYVEGDKVLDSETGDIRGEVDNAPDAEMGENSGIIVEDDVEQDLGDVDIEHDGTDGGSIIVDGKGCVNADNLNFRINVKGGRWYFFCFPFDVRSEDIKMEGGASWVFRYYDGAERAKNGKGGWKNVTSDGDGNHLKAATGYIFQCSKDDVLILTAKNQKIKHEKKYNELVEHITGNAHDASWNFVGNPYLSYYEVSSEDYSAPLTVWDGSKYIAIRPGDDDYQLAPFEAFFVQKPEGVAEVGYTPERQHTYHSSKKAAEQARARRRAMPINPDRLLVNITLSDGTATDQTRVVFNDKVSMEYEMACDAAKFSTAGVSQLYTIDSRAVKYAINERPVAEGIVTVGFTVPVQGNYTLAAPRMDTPIYIKDNFTGTIHDFSKGSYEFASEAGTFDDRFTVIMKAGKTGIDNAEIGNQKSEIYNVKGQRVNEATEQGVYIKENRKVVIK